MRFPRATGFAFLCLLTAGLPPVAGAEAPALTQNQSTIRLGVAAVTSGKAGGSAFFVGQEGLLVTSQQAAGRGDQVTLWMPTGGERKARVVKRDRTLGVVLLRIDDWRAEALPIRLQAPPVGTRLFAIGAPLEETPITAGRVRARNGTFLRSDMTILPESSGGPVLDEFGNIVAVAKQAGGAKGSDLVPIVAALQALGVERGKLAGAAPKPAVKQAALRAPDQIAPDQIAPDQIAPDQIAWHAIRYSRKATDYRAFAAAYPDSEYATLAVRRAAVPANRLWDPAFAEEVPPEFSRNVTEYFDANDRQARRRLTKYNEQKRIASNPTGNSHWVAVIDNVEVLAADEEAALVELLITVHRNWEARWRYIYRFEWINGQLEPVRHQRSEK